MRRIVAIAVGALAALSLMAPPAQAAISKRYRGHLSDGSSIQAVLQRGHAGALRVRSISFEAHLTCEDAMTTDWIVGIGFGRGPAVVDHAVEVDVVDPDTALHIHGTFGPHRASGDFRFSVPALTEDEQAQLCTTGDLTWTMRRIADAPGIAPESADASMHVEIGRLDARPIVRIRS
jgi:hypothetical protein